VCALRAGVQEVALVHVGERGLGRAESSLALLVVRHDLGDKAGLPLLRQELDLGFPKAKGLHDTLLIGKIVDWSN